MCVLFPFFATPFLQIHPSWAPQGLTLVELNPTRMRYMASFWKLRLTDFGFSSLEIQTWEGRYIYIYIYWWFFSLPLRTCKGNCILTCSSHMCGWTKILADSDELSMLNKAHKTRPWCFQKNMTFVPTTPSLCQLGDASAVAEGMEIGLTGDGSKNPCTKCTQCWGYKLYD